MEILHEHGMSSAAFYKWRAKYGGMDASLMARMKELERENAGLKEMYAETQINTRFSGKLLEKSGDSIFHFRMRSSFLRLFVTPPVGYADIPLFEGD